MKKNVACLLACLCLIIVFAFQCPDAMADLNTLDFSLLPGDTIAVLISPENGDQPRIIYALYGITKDDEILSVSVRQISTDPQLTIYEESVVNTDEQDIRFGNFFTADQPIIGSYCDATIETNPDAENARDRWTYPQQEEIIPHGHYMDETFFFPLADLGDADEKFTLTLSYNCIPEPGTLDRNPLCLFTIDLAEYMNPDAMSSLATLDGSLLPGKTNAIFLSPEKAGQPRMVYALHSVTRDEEFLFVNVRQICTDPQLVVYDDYLSNVSELYIRQTNEFNRDTPIVGSFCEARIWKDPAAEDFHDRWCTPDGGHISPNGHYMDEQIDFKSSELKDIEGPIILVLEYFCNPLPGDSSNRKICEITIKLSDYLN